MEPIELFFAFLELQSHTDDGMAKHVIKYIREVCNLDFLECRGKSYDNAACMTGCYKGMHSFSSGK